MSPLFGIERDDRAAVRRPLAVLVRERDPVLERSLGGALERDVDREADRVARLRDLRHEQLALRPAERVDAELGQAVLPAQDLVERGFDTGLADPVTGDVALLPHVLQLLGGDLADVAEPLREQLLGGIRAEVRLLEVDARELALVLVEVVHDLGRDRNLQRDRRQRVVLVRPDLLAELPERDVEDLRELADLGVAARACAAGWPARRRPPSTRRSGRSRGRAGRRSCPWAPRWSRAAAGSRPPPCGTCRARGSGATTA